MKAGRQAVKFLMKTRLWKPVWYAVVERERQQCHSIWRLNFEEMQNNKMADMGNAYVAYQRHQEILCAYESFSELFSNKST
jgi:hypothetical protein